MSVLGDPPTSDFYEAIHISLCDEILFLKTVRITLLH